MFVHLTGAANTCVWTRVPTVCDSPALGMALKLPPLRVTRVQVLFCLHPSQHKRDDSERPLA